MKKVYIVILQIGGCYPQIQTMGVFISKEKAQEKAQAVQKKHYGNKHYEFFISIEKDFLSQ